MGTSKDILTDRIYELEQEVKQLKKYKKHIYVHDTDTIWVDYGELHLQCEQGKIVFNMETLFNDLPTIIGLCIEEQEKSKQEILEQISKLTKL